MIKPLVSVCCITYQHVHYIKGALDGFLMQKTDFPFEICLGEDESDDGTREICQEYAKKYPDKIRLFLRRREDVIYINGCATGRYNIIETLKECKGKYIAHCDGDDYWTDPYKLQKQVDFMEKNNDFSLVFHRFDILEKNKRCHSPLIKKSECNIEDFATMTIPIQPLTVLFRNNLDPVIPDKYQEKVTGFNFILLRLAELGKFKYIDEVMATYRIHGGGVWSGTSYFNRHLNALKNMLAMIEYMSKNKLVKGLLVRSYLKKASFFILYTIYKLEFRFTIKFINKFISLSRL
jgi:glycosyltransferase involved in cell wall biosynthesis